MAITSDRSDTRRLASVHTRGCGAILTRKFEMGPGPREQGQEESPCRSCPPRSCAGEALPAVTSSKRVCPSRAESKRPGRSARSPLARPSSWWQSPAGECQGSRPSPVMPGTTATSRRCGVADVGKPSTNWPGTSVWTGWFPHRRRSGRPVTESWPGRRDAAPAEDAARSKEPQR